jgi:hypothetical protein
MNIHWLHFQDRQQTLSRVKSLYSAGLFTLSFFALLFGALKAAATRTPAASQLKVMTWANPNTPDWDQRLHVSGTRYGCTAEPANCLKGAAPFAENRPGQKVFLSVAFKPDIAVKYAQEYSNLSPQYPFLQEIGIDDFVGQYARLFSSGGADPVSMLSSMIDAAKSQNRALQFGITLYENELESPYLKEPKMTAGIRNKVDNVHLFLIYRANAPNYANYVRQAKKVFPNAKVIAGVYAYDRISYIPCSPSASRHCSQAEELSLFRQALDVQIRLLVSGEVEWLEFLPGAFGKEDEWKNWDTDPRVCPGRKQECISNTKQMRQAVSAAFSQQLGW